MADTAISGEMDGFWWQWLAVLPDADMVVISQDDEHLAIVEDWGIGLGSPARRLYASSQQFAATVRLFAPQLRNEMARQGWGI